MASLYGYSSRDNGMHDHMLDISNMSAEKAFVVEHDGPQLFRASMAMDWASLRGSMELYSVDLSGKRRTLHAKCNAQLHKPQVYEEYWQRHLYLIKRSISQLEHGVDTGSTEKIHRGMAYKLFSSAVQYGPAFQGLQEVLFDSQSLEATARVCIPSCDDHYALNPFCCDSLGHITGFIMNSNDSLDLIDHVYINHGWRHMRFSESFSPNVNYQTYVKMQATREDDSIYSGDVHVLCDGKIVAICEEVTFQKVPRRLLEMLLPSPMSSTKRNIAKTYPSAVTPPTPATTVSTPSSASVVDVEAKSGPGDPGILSQVFQIISDEIGVGEGQLTDDAHFADLGVDSLMSLTMLGTFREDLDLDLPASLFNDYPSVKALKGYLSGIASGLDVDIPESEGVMVK